MKNSLKKVIALATVAVMLLCMLPVVSAASDFVIAAGEVTGELGDSTVEIPLNITKMFADETIGGITVEVNYDPEKFTFEESDWTPGPLIRVPNDAYLNVQTPGLIRIMFATVSDPISAAMVEEDSLFGSVTLGIKDTSVAFARKITLTTNDDLYDEMANSLISMDDMAASLVAGKVTIGDPDESEDTADAIVTGLSIDETNGSVTVGAKWADVLGVLPQKATAELSNNTTKKYSITWEKPDGFSADEEATYSLEGKVTINDLEVEDGVETTLVFTLKIKEKKAVKIISAERVTVTVGKGLSASQALAKLPSTVTVTGDAPWYKGEKSGPWSVSWRVGSEGFAGNVEDDYEFIGTLDSEEGYIIEADVKAIVTVEGSSANQGTGTGLGSGSVIGALIADDDEEEEESVEIKFCLGDSHFTFNGITSYMDVPFMYNAEGDRTLVPVRFISEILKYNVEWEEANQLVTITKDNHKIELIIGNETMYVNGTPVAMDTAPIIHMDRTFVPIRFVAENFGLTVGFDNATQQVTLTK